MDKHPIETWDELVRSMLHPAILLPSAPAALHEYLVTAKDLKEAVRRQLLRDTINNKTETAIKLLVERYQAESANLLDLLFYYQHYESITRELIQFYQAVSAQLEAIINLLRNNYGRYFNADLNLPLHFHHREGVELKRYWKIIAQTLSQCPENLPIVKLLNQCINGVLHHNDETVMTYQQASYFKYLLKEFSRCLSSSASTPGYVALTELLIRCNFNEFSFIQEVCTGIKTEVDNRESDELKLEFLKSTQKQVIQILEKSNAAYHPAQPAAKQTILEWIAQEIAWLEGTDFVPEKAALKEGFKIHTSISVPVLALIIRLFKESGIVTNINQTEILKLVAGNFTTLRKSELSHGHLQSKYYEIDEGTKRKVCDYFMSMVQLSKKL
ncbi:hypothetical protein A4D02_13790 [Niastella koreensis]|uniref:Uncharacterized protein n=2 Tax=Niastella koreensis TaxID=354356 RepID=G8TQ25_NIAKG|nr:hypothetical protein [Niastella koreensis]AEW01026.1 hypothetical protein Niako_4775 [Niastella koreensis GR20-10]OQP42631.1 hypothetical protein A4D02_13790 [Niastella koreensis]